MPWFLPTALLATFLFYSIVADEDVWDSIIEVPLSKRAGSGIFTLSLRVGVPPVQVHLIVDTGSHITSWDCRKTSHYCPRFSRSAQVHPCHACVYPQSRCFDNSCSVGQHYKEGSSWTGFEITEMIFLNRFRESNVVRTDRQLQRDDQGILPIPLVVACQTQLSRRFREQAADGILALEPSETMSLPNALYQRGLTERSSFSWCFDDSGGWFSFGGPNERRHTDLMQWTTLYNETSRLSVGVVDITLGDAVLTSEIHHESVWTAINTHGIVVDTGTTDMYLPKSLEHLFLESWHEQTGRRFPVRRSLLLDTTTLETLPDLVFVLTGGFRLVVPAASYLEGASPLVTGLVQKVYVSPRLFFDDGQPVLGSNAMLDHDFFYDSTTRRLGIAPSDCS